MRIAFVACTQRHKDKQTTVEDMFSTSPLFRHSVNYCRQEKFDEIYALNAEHGVLKLDTEISPQSMSLHSIQRRSLRDWLEKTSNEIRSVSPGDADLYFFTGKRYRRLIPYLDEYNCHEPLGGMGIGKQLNFLVTSLKK